MDDEERIDAEEEMELDEASDGDDDDEETSGISISPANLEQLLEVPSTPGHVNTEEVFHDSLQYQKFPYPGGKPLNIRRGPGRPRKERPPGSVRGGGTRRYFSRGSARGKGLGYTRGMLRRTKSKDDDIHSESPSPLRFTDDPSIDSESSADKSMPAPEEPPCIPEQWPRKVCAFCNLGERSQLGQGELVRLLCPEGFTPEKKANRDETPDLLLDVGTLGDKSPRGAASGGAVTCRRQKSLAKFRNSSLTNFSEPIEELTIVGFSEEPELGTLFEVTGHYFVHQSCAIWSSNSQVLLTENISPSIVKASSRRCAYCSHYGAGIPCKVGSCNRYFHLPCAAASSCYQDIKTLSLFCGQHLGQVPLLLNSDISCMQCCGIGDIINLIMCSICGTHYHGNCINLTMIPSVRAGWQCLSCRVCQVCRQPEELSKIMVCEQCHKAYHPGCLRPVVTTAPKHTWKCKCCRACTDCGSRTPGAGLSSRWHANYTVCDSCYQQRNKGFSCPLCRKAYRAAAYREMVQCSSCKKFVHGTCDPEADPITHQHRKDAKPDYEYVCLYCKNLALVKRKDHVDDYNSGDNNYLSSQELLYGDGDSSEFDYPGDDPLYSIGLGKGKPFCASKIAKKRLGLPGVIGRPKGVGKVGYQKRQKMNEFGRKRGPKAKMRGIFGVPGVGLQRPMSDSSKEEEPGVENRLVLCSAKDKFVLTQDICVMCGAIGTDAEGCLIACAQCGQCYHPYCANVKVTKVILQRGWRCLDCTVCEGCGERNDEGRLILCDDCDISYHIYCMDPPLDYVPHGTWKCKWCAVCQVCGTNDPGFNSCWQKNYTQCGPCASHNNCASCQEPYNEGDLIIQCVQCERWIHCACDHIKTEADAEKCAEEGYNCVLCRPRDVPPPHLLCNIAKQQQNKYTKSPPPITRSPELYKPTPQHFLIDGVYLSEAGMHQIKSLTFEQQQTRKKRRKLLPIIDKDADIMATIESVVAGGSLDNSLEENSNKGELVDVKDEPGEVLKEGMVWNPRGDQPPPEGFSIYTTENGVTVLRRKRQRNLQKLGIGGFVVRLRGNRKDKDDEGEPEKNIDGNPSSIVGGGTGTGGPGGGGGAAAGGGGGGGGNDDKPRRKVQRRKPKTKLSECFPLYMQEAFFGKDLMDLTKDKDIKSSSDSDSEKNTSSNGDTIMLSQEELKAIEQVKPKIEDNKIEQKLPNNMLVKREENIDDDTSDTEALGDILPISSDLLDNELVNTLMNEPDEDLAKASEALEELDGTPGQNSRDELTDILNPHFNLESMVRDTGLPNMDSKDVEEIFKGVLTDESQESQESSVFPIQNQTAQPPPTTRSIVSPSSHAGLTLGRPQVPNTLPAVAQSNLNSPMSFPPPSPYHSEYSNSPQFSPAFSEPPSPWVNPEEEGSTGPSGVTISYNQRSNLKMEADEALGTGATISSVLYANINHPEWKIDYPVWSERCKQILKKWRALSTETKAPYLSQARDNRAANRMKKTQQISKDLPSTTPVTTTSVAPTIITKPVSTITSTQQVPTVVATPTSAIQKPVGLLVSITGDKQNPQQQQQQQHHQKVPTNLGTTGIVIATSATPSPNSAALTAGVGNHLEEVCAVSGPSKQLTSTSPSLSPTSTSSSSSSVNSVNCINNLNNNTTTTATNITNTTTVTTTTTIITHPDNINLSASTKLTQSPATTVISTSSTTTSFCNNTTNGDGQRQSSANQEQQRSSSSTTSSSTTSTTASSNNHITISTSGGILNNQNNNNNAPHPQAASIAAAATSSNTLVVAGTVRQLSSIDHQIRVLTPSEIMRTLPSLSQEQYDPPPTAIIHTVPVQTTPAMEQERLVTRDRSTREAEQERQWKQLQAIRQQQAQMQQQVIQEQRAHAMARAHRQITDDITPQLNVDTNTALTTQLQVSPSQDTNTIGPVTSPSSATRNTFATPPIKTIRGSAPQSPRLTNQPCTTIVRPVGAVVRQNVPNTFAQPLSPFSPQAPQSPHDVPQSPASSHAPDHFQRFENQDSFPQNPQTPRSIMVATPGYETSPRNDVFPQTPNTPRPVFNTPTPRASTHVYAPCRTPDPYNNQPSTPSPALSYPSPRPEPRQDVQPSVEVFNQQLEINPQLRDLLQRQQLNKKLDSPAGIWNQDNQTGNEPSQQPFESNHVQISQHSPAVSNPVEGTFRHPLPPGMRQRMPIQLNVFIRNSTGIVDSRLQGIDSRTRMLLQRPPPQANTVAHHLQSQVQQQQQQQQRMTVPKSPTPEQYDVLQQAQSQQQTQRFPDTNQTHNQNVAMRLPRSNQGPNQNMKITSTQTVVRQSLTTVSTINDHPPATESSEIPDNVTAELEKLEQEGTPMGEVEGVSAILGDLADDDDELLAAMGGDFNILEYADPELDNITGGEKTNILDMDLEQVEEETKDDKQKKESKELEQKAVALTTVNPDVSGTTSIPTTVAPPPPPPPPETAIVVSVTLCSTIPSITTSSQTQTLQQSSETLISQNYPQAVVVQQQMHQHVQQVVAMGRPMPPGTRLLSPDGAVGVVTSTNNVTVSYPSSFPNQVKRIQQPHIQLQHPRLGMRLAGVQSVTGKVVQLGSMIGPRMPLAPPPPPPYPGPPPPYPGPVQMGLCPGGRGMPRPPVHIGHRASTSSSPMAPIVHTNAPVVVPHSLRRPLLLQEQPLLLEDLLEQEKREQEKQQQQQQQPPSQQPPQQLQQKHPEQDQQQQQQQQPQGPEHQQKQTQPQEHQELTQLQQDQSRQPQQRLAQPQQPATPSTTGTLLSDSDFERLRADVFGINSLSSPPQAVANTTNIAPIIRPPARVSTLNISQLPAPPLPPEIIATEQDRQAQVQYEQWLNHQHQILSQQQKFYETEVQKLRKVRKSLNSKQRQLRKSGNELTENDAAELQRISSEQAILQKQLDASRKQTRQHGMLIQEYQSKQQQRQVQAQSSEPCSPLMSPSQHSSPMHSPAALVSHSPGPGSVVNMVPHSPAASIIPQSPNPSVLHSPSSQHPANPGTISPQNIQASPRIGTPHSQSDESPFSPSPMPTSGICGPTATRMASPQHRTVVSGRLTTNSSTFQTQQQMIGEQGVRMQNMHQKFVRPSNVTDISQRPRMQIQSGIIYGQRSPLGSPQPSQQIIMSPQQHQQILQRQQQLTQYHEVNVTIPENQQTIVHQRTIQLAQQRHQLMQQQQRIQFIQLQQPQQQQQQQQQMQSQQQQQHEQQQQHQHQQHHQKQQQEQQHHQQVMHKPDNSPISRPLSSPSPQIQQIHQNYGGQCPSSPMPRSPIVQQMINSPMISQLNQNSQPPSPMNARIPPQSPSPMMPQQYQPPSPMTRPSTSPMLQHQSNMQHPPPCQTPNSPMAKSPMIPGSSSMQVQKKSDGSSPVMPDRPQSVENPATPRSSHISYCHNIPHSSLAPMSDQNPQDLQQPDHQQKHHQPELQHQQSHSEDNSGQSNDHNMSKGGGNPHNPINPIPLFRQFGRYGFFKLGLRGGSPMWSTKPESSKGKSTDSRVITTNASTNADKPNTSSIIHRKSGISPSKMNSLVSSDYNDFDDDSHTPPQTPPAEAKSNLPASTTVDKTSSSITLGLGSPDKLDTLPDTTDYDDDKTIVNEEVTLSSTAQRDSDDITVIEELAESELVDVTLGALDSDMQEEYVLFEPDMVVDISVDSNDSLSNALVNNSNQGHDLVQILEIERSQVDDPNLSDDELLSASREMKKNLPLDLVRSLQAGKQLVSPTEFPETEVSNSPDNSAFIDHSSGTELVALVEASEVVIIDSGTKSPDDNLSKESCGDDETDKSENGNDDNNLAVETSESKNNLSFNVLTTSAAVSATVSSTVNSGNKSGETVGVKTNPMPNVTAENENLTSKHENTTADNKSSMFTTEVPSSSDNQKQLVLPTSMSSIVTDAKIAAKLSQTVMETSLKSHKSVTNNISDQDHLILQNNYSNSKIQDFIAENVTLKNVVDVSNVTFIPVKTTDSASNLTKLAITVKPTSVTLMQPKMSISELPVQENSALESGDVNKGNGMEKQAENVNENKNRKTNSKKNNAKINSDNNLNLGAKDETDGDNLPKDKEMDSLNTTDELESMLEAMHNTTENVDNKEKSIAEPDLSSFKRISPVSDEISLVNILENDSEPIVINDRKAEFDDKNQINSPKQSASKQMIEDNKSFSDNIRDNVVDESSDDILDMLQNIIASKPEMANTNILDEERARKTSLIYQVPTPLDTLPFNILQDPLVDLDQQPHQDESSSSGLRKIQSDDEKPQNLTVDNKVSSDNNNQRKSSSPSQIISNVPTAQTVAISTVAQLQKSTTTVPHLSPLSKPTELTSNVANVSHQLRTLLSSLQSSNTQNCSTSHTMTATTVSSTIIPSSQMGKVPTSTVYNSAANMSFIHQQTSVASSTAKSLDSTSTTAALQLKDNANLGKISQSEQFSRSMTSTVQTQSIVNLPLAPNSRPTTSSGISITSNAMLNAMLSGTSSAKPSIAGHRSNTILTQASNLLSSVVPSASIQRTQNLQAILQVSSTPSSIISKVIAHTSSNSVSSSLQCTKTIPPPLVNVTNTINVTTSILQSTLSQTSTLLHSQLTSGPGQYKSTGLLPIDNKTISNKVGELESHISSSGKDVDDSKNVSTTKTESEGAKMTNHRIEESQNVLLKQLLQNTACATTTSPSNACPTSSTLSSASSLEVQLARPVPPPPSNLLPPLLNKPSMIKLTTPKQVLNRETSFVSLASPIKSQSPPSKDESGKISATQLLPTSSGQQMISQKSADSGVKMATASQQYQRISAVNQAGGNQSTATATAKQILVTSTSKMELSDETISAQVPLLIKTSIGDSPIVSHQNPPTSVSTTFTKFEAPLNKSVTTTAAVITTTSATPAPKINVAAAQVASSIQQSLQPTAITTSTPTPTPATTPQSPQVPLPETPNQISVQKSAQSIQIQQHQCQQKMPQPQQKLIIQQQQTSEISTIQPSVPQQIAHQTVGHQIHLQQGAITPQQQQQQPQSQSQPQPQQQPTVPLVEVKKEILDEVLSGSTATQLADTKDFFTAKDEFQDGAIDEKTDLKKLKRRQYQQKRRQSQGKDVGTPPQKKRSRKVSRLDEDYDTFIDNLMIQLRQLQPMAVLEPLLGRNFGVSPIFGSGDLSKVGSVKDYNPRTGDLIGDYGNAKCPGMCDYYNTRPFGDLEPSPPDQPVSTQRGFYDQEFPPLKLDDSIEKKDNLTNRDIDTPDTIISSSSPECVIPEFSYHFPGLRLIEEESDEDSDWLKRVSPVLPIVSPIPIRFKPIFTKDTAKHDKENIGSKLVKSPSLASIKENVTVTLTLNSQAADDIMRVLKDLANILNISPPNNYQIVERTTTPPSQKLGLYRTKGKDGKEGAPIDIQSILNGAAKFCRHCDVVILNTLIRKKVSDLPFLSKEEVEPGDELCFCSPGCYMQFALMHRTPASYQGKAATIVDHLCQKSDQSKSIYSSNSNPAKKKIPEKKVLDNNAISTTLDHNKHVEPIEPCNEIKIKPEHEENEIRDIKEEHIMPEEKRPKKHPASEFDTDSSELVGPPSKLWRGLRYKIWSSGVMQPSTKYKKPSDKDITDLLFRMAVTVTPAKTEDSRRCMFCQIPGDGAADGPARLLNFDVDKWVHLNCALWSENVYETVNGALMNLDTALQNSLVLNCIICEKPGATVKCFKMRCTNVYHLSCAVKDGCVFYKNKSTYCSQHVQKNEKDSELTTLAVYRRVYVNRDENRQVAAVMHHTDHNHLLRVGSLIFLNVGQLLPHQLANFHTPNYIYPVGYKIVRFYWSMRRPNKRCRYVCSIHDVSGRPEFRVLIQEPSQEDVELRDVTPKAVWSRILEPLAELRRSTQSVQLFPRYVSGEDLFGLTEPAVVRVLENLPGIETLTDYRYKYGRNPLLELPLAINPSGSARTEARLRNQLPWKKPHTQRTGSSARAAFAPAVTVAGEVACPYSKQFVHSKSSQYKKMKQDWRNNVYLARSKIQGLGLYAARDLEKHQMVIEYIGEIIRTELAETREKQYEARNRGIYMFRLDEERVVDATLCGGLARYINHSCNPNCVAEIVEVERDLRIIIFAKRRISRGEELAYDYKFDIEDDQHKIACSCAAPNCRKWMN